MFQWHYKKSAGKSMKNHDTFQVFVKKMKERGYERMEEQHQLELKKQYTKMGVAKKLTLGFRCDSTLSDLPAFTWLVIKKTTQFVVLHFLQ